MKNLILSAIAAGFAVVTAPAFAACPGGVDNAPFCVTGLPTWIASGPNCEKYEVAGLNYAIVYNSSNPEATKGFRDGLDKGISVSVLTESTTTSPVCDGGKFYIISGVRNALY